MRPSDHCSDHFSPCPPLLPPSTLCGLWKWPSNWFPFFLLCALAVYFPPGTHSDLSEMSFQNITLPLSTFQWRLSIFQIKSKVISRACKTLVTRPFLDISFCTWPLPYSCLSARPSSITFLHFLPSPVLLTAFVLLFLWLEQSLCLPPLPLYLSLCSNVISLERLPLEVHTFILIFSAFYLS